MKYALAASMMALGLAACGGGGGGDKAALVEKCMEEGESKADCTCQVNAFADALGDDAIGKMAKAAKTEDEDAVEALMMEIMMKDPAAMGKMTTAMMACATDE